MAYALSLWNTPSLEIVGSSDRFPVRRIFCVGRNYVEHQKEMGGDGREQPFFFIKSAHSLVSNGGDVHYPAKTSNYHYETELVVALAKGEGLNFAERPFSIEEAKGAREAFVTSASSFVLPVSQIDDRVIGNGKAGSITRRLRERYLRYMDEAGTA